MGLLDTIYTEAKKERGPLGLRVGDFVPYVSGLLAADDARLAAQQGNYGEAAGALAGLVPGGRLVKKLTGVDLNSVSPRQIFAGAKAKGADLNAMQRAEQRLSAGDDPRKVWAEEGWFRGPDGKMRWEIDDRGLQLSTAQQIAEKRDSLLAEASALREGSKGLLRQQKIQPDLFPQTIAGARKTMREQADAKQRMVDRNYGYGYSPSYLGNFAEIALPHQKLYEAYPDIARNVVEQKPLSGYKGWQQDERIALNTNYPAESMRSTGAHELQHAVQDAEGFAGGGNSTMAFADKAVWPIYNQIVENMKSAAEESGMKFKLTPDLDRSAQQTAADEWYKRLAGEAEARAVQARLDMTPDARRQIYPLDSYDRPIDQLIVRGLLDGN